MFNSGKIQGNWKRLSPIFFSEDSTKNILNWQVFRLTSLFATFQKPLLNFPEGEKSASFWKEKKLQWQKCCLKRVPCLPHGKLVGLEAYS